MINEYALEPSLLSRWSDFRFYISQFGFEKGRLISEYPSKWRRHVYQSLSGCGPIEKARIEEAMRRINDRLIRRGEGAWDNCKDWLNNAEDEHNRNPFHAIIAETNIRRHPEVIAGKDLDDTIDYSKLSPSSNLRLWKASRSKIVKRTAQEMADAIDTYIKHAKTIHFVDKHFGPENVRHRIPFEEFMSRLNKQAGAKRPEIFIHCAKISEKSFFEEECENKLAPKVPTGVDVRFIRWEKTDLHNRFVLTDLGGVTFLEGLDQYGGNGREEDVVAMLDTEVARQLIENYTLGKTTYSLIDQYQITGTRASAP